MAEEVVAGAVEVGELVAEEVVAEAVVVEEAVAEAAVAEIVTVEAVRLEEEEDGEPCTHSVESDNIVPGGRLK